MTELLTKLTEYGKWVREENKRRQVYMDKLLKDTGVSGGYIAVVDPFVDFRAWLSREEGE